MSPEIISLDLPGLELSARVWGPRDGLPVLALHGWLDNACSFDALAPLLGSLRIVAVDLPGHGRSGHYGPGRLYAFVDLVSDVLWAAEALGWQRFAILGHSLGAAIGSILAGTIPERITHLVLLDGIGPASGPAAGAPERLRRAWQEQQRRARAGSAASVVRRRQQLVELAQAARDMTPQAAEILLGGGIDEREGGFAWSSDPALRLASRLRMTEEQVLAFLGCIRSPTLFVRARQGFPMDASVVARLAAVANLQTCEVEGRHHVHLEAPGTIQPLIAAFFQEHPEPR